MAMSNSQHVIRRGNVYYFRRKIPLDLLAQYPAGKKEITKSLGTKDPAVAARLARRLSVELDDLWADMRGAPALAAPEIPTHHDLVEVVGKIIAVPPPPGGWPPPPSISPAQADAADLAVLEAAEHVRQEEHAEEAAEAEAANLIAALRRLGMTAVPLAPAAPQVARQEAATGPQGHSPQPPSAMRLGDIIELWQKDRHPTTKTIDAVTTTVVEAGDPLITIGKQGIIGLRDKWRDSGNSIKTTNKKLDFLRLLFGIAVSRGLLDKNPVTGTHLPLPKRAVEERRPYSKAQAEAVLSATAHLEATDPALYWLPRLARLTGARLNELHQLRREDLQERDGHPGIMLTDLGEHAEGVAMTLKTAGSRRWVPLHPDLAPFITWARGRADGPLFPAKPNKYGVVSDAFSKRYGRFIRDKVGITDKLVTFHSWRHSFADLCRAAEIAPDTRHALMGHSEGGTAGAYGSGEGPPPRVLIAAIKKLGT